MKKTIKANCPSYYGLIYLIICNVNICERTHTWEARTLLKQILLSIKPELVLLLLYGLGSTQPACTSGSDQTDLASSWGVPPDCWGFANMLMVTTTEGMLHGLWRREKGQRWGSSTRHQWDDDVTQQLYPACKHHIMFDLWKMWKIILVSLLSELIIFSFWTRILQFVELSILLFLIWKAANFYLDYNTNNVPHRCSTRVPVTLILHYDKMGFLSIWIKVLLHDAYILLYMCL